MTKTKSASPKIRKTFDIDSEFRSDYMTGVSKKERHELWAEWSATDKDGAPIIGFPDELMEKIEDLNSRNGLDIHDKYGFAFVSFCYYYNLSEEIVSEFCKPDIGNRNEYIYHYDKAPKGIL